MGWGGQIRDLEGREWAGMGGADKRFRGEGESLWCVFEWKYMMYCVSLC